MTTQRAQLLDDSEEALRIAFDSFQASVWTALPGVVQSVDLAKMTCEVQPSIQGVIQNDDGTSKNVDYPLLLDVPIVFPSANGFALTFPLHQGDEVLVVFASRAIDSWWQSGGTANQPVEARMHDLSDGFCIPGPKSQPNVLVGAISTTATQLRNSAGTAYVGLDNSGKIQIVNPTNSMKTLLNGMLDLTINLETALSTFASACAGSVTDPVLAAAATALGPSLVSLSAAVTAYKVIVGGLVD